MKLSFENLKSTGCYKADTPFTILTVLVVFALFCVSCSVDVVPTSEKFKAEEDIHPIAENEISKEYPNLPVGYYLINQMPNQYDKLLARFPKEVSSVKIDNGKGVFVESDVKPKGCYWLCNYDKNFDPKSIIGLPKDGTPEISLKKISTYRSKMYFMNYDPKIFDEQEISFSNFRVAVSKAFLDINGSLIELNKDEQNVYRYRTTLPESPCAKVYFFFDKEGKIVVEELRMSPPMKKRKYYCPMMEVFQRDSICSTDINGFDFRLEYFLDPPKPEPLISDNGKQYEYNTGFSKSIQTLSLSKDARYFFLSSEWRITFETDYSSKVFINGRRILRTKLTDYIIFDSKNRSYHIIGTFYSHELIPSDNKSPNFIEKGDIVLPVKWFDDKVVCSLVTKFDKEKRDSEIDSGKPNVKTGAEEACSPYVTTKGIEVDLSTFKYKDSEDFKPLSPFMSFADDSTGMIGYDDIHENSDTIDTSIQLTTRFNDDYAFYTNVITNYLHTKEYRIIELFKQNLPSGYHITKQQYCGSRMIEGKKTLFFFLMGDNIPPETGPGIRGDLEIKPGFTEFLLLFSLDFETGKTTRIIDMQKKSEEKWPQGTPSFYFISLGSGDNTTNLWADELISYPDENGRWPEQEVESTYRTIIVDGKPVRNNKIGRPVIEGYIR